MKEINGIISSASIRIERGFILDSWLSIDLQDGGTQGFGGYALYLNKTAKHHNILSHAGHWIYRIMEIAGVEDWEKLNGKAIRIRKEDSWNGEIIGIGHIVKNDWFIPEEDFKSMETNK